MKYLDFILLFLLIIIILCQCNNYQKKERFNDYKAPYEHHRLATVYDGVAGSMDPERVTDTGTMGNGPYDSWISPFKTHLDNFYTTTESYPTGTASGDNIPLLCQSSMTPLKTRIRDLGSYGGTGSTKDQGIDYIPGRDKESNMFYYNVYDGGKAYDTHFNEWNLGESNSTIVTNMACKRGFENMVQSERPTLTTTPSTDTPATT